MSELPDWLEEAENNPYQISLFEQQVQTGTPLEELRELSKQPISKCECCGGRSKVYAYKLGSYARVLCWMAHMDRVSKNSSGDPLFWHVPSSGAINGGGDYAKLRYWDLIAPQPTNPDPKKRSSGMWKLTDLGRDFVYERTSVSSTCYYRHPEGGVIGFEPEQIGIRDALGKHFDYQALMKGPVSPSQHTLDSYPKAPSDWPPGARFISDERPQYSNPTVSETEKRIRHQE